MIPVKQNNKSDEVGNCYSACIASILEIGIDDVPNFCKEDVETGKCMFKTSNEWLINKHNKKIKYIHLTEYTNIVPNCQQEYFILCGESPRKKLDGSTKCHAVVGKAKVFKNEPEDIFYTITHFDIVHDPHPDNTGLAKSPYAAIIILPL